MSVTNSPAQLIGDFKNIYQKSGLVDAIPQWAIIQDRFPFEAAQATGDKYVFGVTLQKENGFTYAASDTSVSTAPALNASVAGYVGRAEVEGYSIFLRSRLSYQAAAKASAAGEKAFAQAYGAVLKNMKESHQYRLELSLLYGRDGLGVVDAAIGGGVFSITAATWATGIWAAGLRDAILEAFTGVSATETQHDGDLTISSVSVADKRITVTGTSSSVVPGDVFYFKGARTTTAYNECAGLYRILTNTTTLFNINAAQQELWKAQSYPVNGNVSMTAIMQAGSVGMNFGLEKALMLCNPNAFGQLGSDEAALRRYVQDTSKTKRGVRGVSFMLGSVDVEVLAHPFIKQGHSMILPEKKVMRTGATDITFAMPGSGEKMEVQVTDATAVELRSMSDQAIFLETPAQAILMTGITAS